MELKTEIYMHKHVLICLPGRSLCWSVISIKLQSNFIEITLRHGCSPVNFLYILKTPSVKNTFGWLLLHNVSKITTAVFRTYEKYINKENSDDKCKCLYLVYTVVLFEIQIQKRVSDPIKHAWWSLSVKVKFLAK